MTREEQVAFCKKCVHGRMELSRGYVCNLTNELADFEDECPDYEINVEIIKEKTEKKKAHEELLKKERVGIIYNYPILTTGDSWGILFVPVIIIGVLFILFMGYLYERIEAGSGLIVTLTSINYVLFPALVYSMNISSWVNFHRCKNKMNPKDAYIYRYELRYTTWAQILPVTFGGILLMLFLGALLENSRKRSMKRIEKEWDLRYEIEKQEI